MAAGKLSRMGRATWIGGSGERPGLADTSIERLEVDES